MRKFFELCDIEDRLCDGCTRHLTESCEAYDKKLADLVDFGDDNEVIQMSCWTDGE